MKLSLVRLEFFLYLCLYVLYVYSHMFCKFPINTNHKLCMHSEVFTSVGLFLFAEKGARIGLFQIQSANVLPAIMEPLKI